MANFFHNKLFNLPPSTTPNSLHHAYLLVGDRAAATGAVAALLTEVFHIEIQGNPDVHWLASENFTIDEARALKSEHFLKAVGETGHSFFIVSFDSIGSEAQQALLKVFEDPVAGSHFFVIAPSLRGLLPTLLSRFVVLHLPRIVPDTSRAEKFAQSSPPARLKHIKKIVEDKDKVAAIAFLNELETFYVGLLRGNVGSSRAEGTHDDASGDLSVAPALQEIVSARNFLQTRSPSVKMLLENLALVLPVV